MPSLRLRSLVWLVPVAFVLNAATASAQWLSTYSPFRPPAGPETMAAPAETRFEYLGFARLPEGEVFRVVDKVKKTAAFLRLNEPDADIGVTARTFDSATDVLVIECDGRRVSLAERRGKIRPTGGAPVAAPTRASMTPAVSAAVIQSVVVNPTPQQEVERLEAIRREIETRRAQREQAAQAALVAPAVK